MLIATEETHHKRNVTGTILNVSEDETYKSSSWTDKMTIETKNDTTIWVLTKTDSPDSSRPGYFAKLQAGTDSFLIKPIDNFSEKTLKRKWFLTPVAGIVVFYGGRQVAAMQTMMRRTVWLSKELDESKKAVLASVMAALLATAKSNFESTP
jgi:hypothetical protein